MNYENFDDMFRTAFGNDQIHPYEYQKEIAAKGFPDVLNVPTGAGKTAAAILGWVWRRQHYPEKTPRRLVYCLPMRVLVRQTWEKAILWLKKLQLLGGSLELDGEHIKKYDPFANPDESNKIRVHLLMGGEADRDWDRYPEHDAILVGTQDMLLSRALNRGYAMSRYRWPVQFALLNNDAFWVMDEVQLMGVGLKTSLQLQAFREKEFKSFGPVKSMWMSATVDANALKTIDFSKDITPRQLPDKDLAPGGPLAKRMNAVKLVQPAGIDYAQKGYEKEIAAFIKANHKPGTRTLVVINTVKRAQAIYKALKNSWKKSESKPEMVLIHSRFRQPEKDKHLATLLAAPTGEGTIAIATQVIEAGVDVSVKTLITELAPWESMVQRFGRCNRKGEYNFGSIIYLEPTQKQAAPYDYKDFELTLKVLDSLPQTVLDSNEAQDYMGKNASPTSLKQAQYLPPEQEPMDILRKRDLLDLFDTTPDLTGMDTDVSRFIRDTNETTCMVAWMDVSKAGPAPNVKPTKSEICPVLINDANKFIKNLDKHNAWAWDHLQKEWGPVKHVRPGQIIILPDAAGGYDPEYGWTGAKPKKGKKVEPVTVESDSIQITGYDQDSYKNSTNQWQTIAEHTSEVVARLKTFLNHLNITDPKLIYELETAARWHDAGKAHDVFQEAIKASGTHPSSNKQWAKSPGKFIRYTRKGFRHELASALAALENDQSDLVAYLAATHHGKVRLSIRALPDEPPPDNNTKGYFARGIWDGDPLPTTDLGGGITMPKTKLDLSYMKLGNGPKGPSWVSRMVAILDDFGPFRMAFLEALLRTADWRAS